MTQNQYVEDRIMEKLSFLNAMTYQAANLQI
jgi:hypothetical protein